jgi:gliding motility-associated-like protein
MKSTTDTKHLIFRLLLMFCPIFAAAQNTFKYSYTHPQAPILFMTHLLDSGDSVVYVKAQRQNSLWYNDQAIVPLLLAMNRQGEVLWAKEFISVNNVTGRVMDLGDIYLSNDGNLNVFFGAYLNIPGDSSRFGTGVVKVSKNGEILSAPNFIDANTDFTGNSITKLIVPNPATGGFVLAGTNQYSTNNPNIFRENHFFAQLDANGQIIPGPENLRFFRPQQGFFDPTCLFLDEQQHCYAGANHGDSLSIVKIKNNATSPEWMKILNIPGEQNFVSNGVYVGNGLTAWVGNGNDNQLNSYGYGFLMIVDSIGDLISFKKYRQTDDYMTGFYRIIKNSAGFLIGDFTDLIIQLDPIGNVIWVKRYIPSQISNTGYIAQTVPAADQNGYWIIGGFERGGQTPFDGLIGKIDLNGNTGDCCSPDQTVEVSDFEYVLTDRPFTVETDSLFNSEWPLVTSNITLSRSSLCSPINFSLPNNSTCTGGCITVLPPALPPGATASWEFPAGASAEFIPGTDSIRICFNNEGPQNLRLNVKLSEECTFPYDNTVTVSNSIKPLVFSLSDTLFCPGICTDIQLNSSSPATITTLGGTAQTGDSLRICYPEAGNYPITVQQMQEGCLRTHTIEVMVQNLLDETPNAFTPNGDGLNETFRPIIDCIPDVYLLQIFNRWGEMVFQTENYLDAWDGTYKGQPAPVDTYIWTVNSNNVQKAYKGDVTLIR